MRLLALTLSLLLLGAAGSVAQGRAVPEVTIMVGEQPPLFSPSGGIVDRVIVTSLEAAGYKVKLEWVPVGRMLTLLQQDSLDRYITASNTAGQGNPHLDFLEARGVLFYKKDRFPGLRADRLEDLRGKSVSTVPNSPNTPLFEKSGMVVDEGPFDAMFSKLDMGRVDFSATADVGGILAIRRQFPGRESEFTFTKLSYSMIRAGLYAKDDPALLAAARRGFAAIRSDGRLDEMLRDFFGAENWRRVGIVY
jgi:hypothetical protein